jgi:hypothetical protein
MEPKNEIFPDQLSDLELRLKCLEMVHNPKDVREFLANADAIFQYLRFGNLPQSTETER